MRNLRAYVCARTDDESMKESIEINVLYEKIKERVKSLGALDPILRQKLQKRASTHILRWKLAESEFSTWKADVKYDGDNAELIHLYNTCMLTIIRSHIERGGASCVVNGRTFYCIDTRYIVYRSDNLYVEFTYITDNILKFSKDLRYNMRHGPVTYDCSTITLGVYTLSMYVGLYTFGICSCRMNCSIGEYNILYHICTNTLRYVTKDVFLNDTLSCSRARVLELWCRKAKIVQKFMAHVSRKHAHLSRKERIIYDFL